METYKRISCLLISLIYVLTVFCAGRAAADIMPPTQSSYSFGPEGRPIDSLDQSFAKPNQMMDILPGRPVAAREKDGSRVYFSPDGKMTLKVATDGTKQFSLGWNTKTVGANGDLQKQSQLVQGTNEIVDKNEKGEVLDYQEIGFGGKVVKEYDSQKNLTKTFTYDKYAKNVTSVLDELSQTKTVFDSNANPKYDLDFEGNTVASYKSDSNGRLVSKVDSVGNTTYFDQYGNMTQTTNMQGSTILKYNYQKDDHGNYVLVTAESIMDGQTTDTTYYQNGKQQYTMNAQGVKTVQFFWSGSQLVYSFASGINETTYYDINGKQLYTAHDDTLVSEWLYFKGKLVGEYDGNSKTTTLYQNQRQDITVASAAEPNAQLIQNWYDDGLIEHIRAIAN